MTAEEFIDRITLHNMTAEEFIDRSAGTFLVIKINDELWVDCFKTCNLSIDNDDKALEISEGNAYLFTTNLEVDDLCIYHKEYDDGIIEEYYIYDTSRSESMKAAHEKLNDIMAKLSNMRDHVDNFRNLVFCDMLNLIKTEKENKQ